MTGDRVAVLLVHRDVGRAEWVSGVGVAGRVGRVASSVHDRVQDGAPGVVLVLPVLDVLINLSLERWLHGHVEAERLHDHVFPIAPCCTFLAPID